MTARPAPTDPSGLYECTLWFMVAELAFLVMYYLCVLRCTRTFTELGDQLRCMDQCLRLFLWSQLALILMYLMCVTAAVWL